MEIDHTITVCEQSRRDQLLLQEQLSEQNRHLRETCIRNMRDMEELQKSHVLKVEELSRRKLTEYFAAVTSFFQGSNVKTVYNLGDNDAKYPDAEIDDEHSRNSLASPLYLQEREESASLLQVSHSQRESLFQRAQSIFRTRRIAKPPLKFAAKYTGYAWFSRKRFWMVYMRVLRQLVQECSIQGISLLRDIFRCKQVRRNP